MAPAPAARSRTVKCASTRGDVSGFTAARRASMRVFIASSLRLLGLVCGQGVRGGERERETLTWAWQCSPPAAPSIFFFSGCLASNSQGEARSGSVHLSCREYATLHTIQLLDDHLKVASLTHDTVTHIQHASYSLMNQIDGESSIRRQDPIANCRARRPDQTTDN